MLIKVCNLPNLLHFPVHSVLKRNYLFGRSNQCSHSRPSAHVSKSPERKILLQKRTLTRTTLTPLHHWDNTIAGCAPPVHCRGAPGTRFPAPSSGQPAAPSGWTHTPHQNCPPLAPSAQRLHCPQLSAVTACLLDLSVKEWPPLK